MERLEAKGRLRILMYLYEKETAQVSVIHEDTGIPTVTVDNALRTLQMLKLTREERRPPYKRFIIITPQGKQLAEKLFEIEKILAETRKLAQAHRADV